MSDILKPINRRPDPVPPPPAPVLSPALHYAVEHEDMSFAGALTETLDFLRTFNDRLHTERSALLRLRDDMEAENARLRAENDRLRGTESTLSQTVETLGTQALRDRERLATAERVLTYLMLALVLVVLFAVRMAWTTWR